MAKGLGIERSSQLCCELEVETKEEAEQVLGQKLSYGEWLQVSQRINEIREAEEFADIRVLQTTQYKQP